MNVLRLPDYIEEIIGRIEAAGYEAYLVGGCVRDMLLGRRPADYDIASGAPPQDILRLFEKTVPNGLKYGTVTVFIGAGRAEVTTFRSEGGYADFRRPRSVAFTGDIQSDLSRRDFTVNAIAFHPRKGLIDPYGGVSDLLARMIRAVGNPNARFDEDALRILRAWRFAAQLDFDIEETTYRAAAAKIGLVGHISGERIKAELEKLLISPGAFRFFGLARIGLLKVIGAEPENPPRFRIDERIIADLPALPAVRWAAALFASNAQAGRLFERLRFGNALKAEISRYLWALREPVPEEPAEIKRLLSKLSPSLFENCLPLWEMFCGRDMAPVRSQFRRIMASGEPYNLKMLAVGGRELIEAGVPQGPECGRILLSLLDYVIEKPDENEKARLIALAKSLLRQGG